MRFLNSCASPFHLPMSFMRFIFAVSCLFTTSICLLVRSSALMTFLFKMSLSRSKSSIFLRSTSPSFFCVSSCSCIDFSSSFSSCLCISSCLRSSSIERSFFLCDSWSFKSFSFSTPCWSISSFLLRSDSSRERFSWIYLLFFASSWSSFLSNTWRSSILKRTLASLACSSRSVSAMSWSNFFTSASSAEIARCDAVTSSCCCSFSSRKSFICCSNSSFRRFSDSTSARFFATFCLMSAIFSSDTNRADSAFRTFSVHSEATFCSISMCSLSMSLSFSKDSFCPRSWMSWVSCSALMPAPCSILASKSWMSILYC
mmetsp:Transcript_51967/g.121684  ORF Transcript_51967/g.121684 Transcript_51967/m.121684 type:complete len:315 (-) Transcript_51967:395-1339(-)